MKIVETCNWLRRDFTATLECESCGHRQIKSCYDDHFFHENVIPSTACENCGKSSKDLGTEVEKANLKYDPNLTL